MNVDLMFCKVGPTWIKDTDRTVEIEGTDVGQRHQRRNMSPSNILISFFLFHVFIQVEQGIDFIRFEFVIYYHKYSVLITRLKFISILDLFYGMYFQLDYSWNRVEVLVFVK